MTNLNEIKLPKNCPFGNHPNLIDYQPDIVTPGVKPNDGDVCVRRLSGLCSEPCHAAFKPKSSARSKEAA